MLPACPADLPPRTSFSPTAHPWTQQTRRGGGSAPLYIPPYKHAPQFPSVRAAPPRWWQFPHTLSRRAPGRPQDGLAPLATAAAYGSVAMVRRLILAGANPEATDREGSTALHHAALHGQADAAIALLGGGSLVGAADRAGDTALHKACRAGHEKARAGARMRKGDSFALPLGCLLFEPVPSPCAPRPHL